MTKKLYYFLFLTLYFCCFNTQAAEQPQLEITEPFIDIRTGPGKSYPIFYIAERGEIVTALKRRTDWFKVELDRGRQGVISGWVHLDDIGKTLSPDIEVPATEDPRLNYVFNRKYLGGFSLGQLNDSDLLAVHLGYKVDDKLTVEIHGSQFFGNSTEGYIGNVLFAYYPYPNAWISPFFQVGGGQIKTEFRSTVVQIDDTSDKFLQTGTGFSIPVMKRYSLRFEYKHLNILTSNSSNEEIESWLVGFGAWF